LNAGSVRREAAVAIAIGCISVAWGVHSLRLFRESGGRPAFYQSEFAPAVMFACGHGLRNPEPETLAALQPFLSETIDSIDCASLPPGDAVGDLDAFQRTARYLELAVGTTWRIVGVSWTRLALLNGLMFGAVATLSYGIFRLGLSRFFSILGVAAVLLSTPNLTLLPHLRDYAKGPFLLAVILTLGLLVVRANSRTATLGLAVAAGVAIGIGLGFRTDLLIAVVPVAVVIACVAPGLSLTLRAAALASFAAAFAVTAYPILGVYARGNNVGPVILLGLTTPFDAALGVEPAFYEYGAQYNDSLIFSIVNSYAVRVQGRNEGVDLASDEHAAASMQYVAALARTFPADFAVRAIAAVRTTARYFLAESLHRPAWLNAAPERFAFWLRGAMSSRLAPFGVAAVIAATLGVAIVNRRAAWLIAVVLGAFAGGSAIQFHERHIFYLQLVPWWALAFLLQSAMRGRALKDVVTARRLAGAGAFALAVAVLAGGGLLVARAWQHRTATRLFESYAAAPRTPVTLTPHDMHDRIRYAAAEWSEPLPSGAPRVATRFLAVAFDGTSCEPGSTPVTLRYESTLPELDFSETVDVASPAGGTPAPTLFFAAFDRPDDSSRFRGIEVDRARARCVSGVSEVSGLERTPLLLTSVLAADWRNHPVYQRLR
jgi:hypothetical protein